MVEKCYHIKGDGLFHDTYTLVGAYEGVKFGLEMELFTVDKRTLTPVHLPLPASSPIKGELAREQIEIATSPHKSLTTLRDELVELTRQAIDLAESQGASLLPIPLLDAQFTIRENPRYQLLERVLGASFSFHAPRVASDQINIGAENEEQAFFLYEQFRNVLPYLTGLSAASPFRGQQVYRFMTRLDSYDMAVSEFPGLTGYPKALSSLEEYAREIESLPVFQHPNSYYKYMRPMPQRGVAAEIRSLDKQPTLSRTLALAALTKGLVMAALDGAPLLSSYPLLHETFSICRSEGEFDQQGTRNLLCVAYTHLPPVEQEFLDPLFDDPRPPATAMVEQFKRGTSIPDIYHSIRDVFHAEVRRYVQNDTPVLPQYYDSW